MAITSTDAARDRVLDAAKEWVAQNGPRRPNLSEIAARSGISRPTVYRHFPTKEALLLAISNSEKDRFERELAAATRGRSGPARLDRALRFIVEFQRDNPMKKLVVDEPAFIVGPLTEAQRTTTPPRWPGSSRSCYRPPGAARHRGRPTWPTSSSASRPATP